MSTMVPTNGNPTSARAENATSAGVEFATFTGVEQRTLNALRIRYAQDRDLFSDWERARLRFLRWLYLTGRIAP